MLAVELERAVPLLQSVGGDLASRAATLARGIRSGIAQHGVVTHPVWGTVFAYEVDGYGSYSAPSRPPARSPLNPLQV